MSCRQSAMMTGCWVTKTRPLRVEALARKRSWLRRIWLKRRLSRIADGGAGEGAHQRATSRRTRSVSAPNTTQRRQLKRGRKVDVECCFVTKALSDLTRIEGIASHYDVAPRRVGARFHKALPTRDAFVGNRIPFWPLIPSRRAARDRVQRRSEEGHGPS